MAELPRPSTSERIQLYADDVRTRLLALFVMVDGEETEAELLGARFYLERAIARLHEVDPATVQPERPGEWAR
jgi:hypothetical protein